MMRPATSGTSDRAARYRPASAKALPGAHKPAPPGHYTIDEILHATARGEEIGTRRRPLTAMSRLATAPRTAQTGGGSASARRALGAIPPVCASSHAKERGVFQDPDFSSDEDTGEHFQRETFHTEASGQGFDVQRLQLTTPPRALLSNHASSPGDSPEGTHWSAARIPHDPLSYADTPPTVPRLNVGAAIKDAQHPGDAWGPPKRHTDDLAARPLTPERRPRGVAHRLFSSPGAHETRFSPGVGGEGEEGGQYSAGVSRRAGTAGTTGPEAWPDVREQKVALSLSLHIYMYIYIYIYIHIYMYVYVHLSLSRSPPLSLSLSLSLFLSLFLSLSLSLSLSVFRRSDLVRPGASGRKS